jgi:hypothetical protein
VVAVHATGAMSRMLSDGAVKDDQWVKETLSVDRFILRHQKAVVLSLEQARGCLGEMVSVEL